MIKKLLSYAKGYGIYAFLSPLAIVFEVLIEVAIPFLMSVIVDSGINGIPLSEKDGFVVSILLRMGFGEKQGLELVTSTGILMVVMACFSLICGASAAYFAAKAGMGFGKNLRGAMFGKIQDYSFSNVDKFSTGSLITRMTTDVNMIQNAFMMAIRMLVRSPLMFIMAIAMAVDINKKLSLVFIIVGPALFAALVFIGSKAHPRFERMFKKYDKFNTSIQENLISIRVAAINIYSLALSKSC